MEKRAAKEIRYQVVSLGEGPQARKTSSSFNPKPNTKKGGEGQASAVEKE